MLRGSLMFEAEKAEINKHLNRLAPFLLAGETKKTSREAEQCGCVDEENGLL